MTVFNFDFYIIEKCGFYKTGENQPEFVDLKDTFNYLMDFIDGKKISSTKTYEAGAFQNLLPTYCYEILKYEDDFFITTWNEIHNDNGQISSLNGDATAGSEAEIDETRVPEGYIPGYPTYFWINISKNYIISVRPEGMSFNGNPGFVNYIRSFLRYYTPHSVVKGIGTEDEKIIGYSKNKNEVISDRLTAKFETKLKTRPTNIDYLVKNFTQITKILKKEKLNFNQEKDEDFFYAVLKKFFVPDYKRRYTSESKFRMELEFTPQSEDELMQIIENYGFILEKEWDLGFSLSGEPSNIWLSSTFEKHKLEFDLNRKNGVFFEGKELIKKILSNKESLLSIVK